MSLPSLSARSYGLIYLAKHPRLVETLKPMIVRSLAISMVTVSAMFTFTYLPQVAALSVISGPLGTPLFPPHSPTCPVLPSLAVP